MVSAFLIGLANHREDDAEGDNASPMTVAQSFPASTTAYPPDPGDAADRRVALVASCHRGERAVRRRNADAQASFPTQRRSRSGRGRGRRP